MLLWKCYPQTYRAEMQCPFQNGMWLFVCYYVWMLCHTNYLSCRESTLLRIVVYNLTNHTSCGMRLTFPVNGCCLLIYLNKSILLFFFFSGNMWSDTNLWSDSLHHSRLGWNCTLFRRRMVLQSPTKPSPLGTHGPARPSLLGLQSPIIPSPPGTHNQSGSQQQHGTRSNHS